MAGGATRIAVIDYDSCKPTKCHHECIVFCPINRTGKTKAIEAKPELKNKPVIYEDTCIGCGICVRKCPFKAISIVNLPSELEENAVHRYGVNGFKLYKLPVPKRGQVLGLIGKNGTGKTTAIKILAGEIKPNLGRVENPPDWDEIIRKFRGSELQNYLKSIADRKLKVAHKIQYVDLLAKYLKGTVGELLEKADERGVANEFARELGLDKIKDRSVKKISGGELQKLLIAAVLSKDADVYIFDEPSSYLDVRERIRVSKIIRRELKENKYYIVVEHDLAVLDYLSDNISIIYGEPGVYGIVSVPYGVRNGINYFLDGFLPTENMRIRKEPIRFRAYTPTQEKETKPIPYLEWSDLEVRRGSFRLLAEPGKIFKGEVIGIIGPNGIGKTTLVNTIAGKIKPSNGYVAVLGDYKISYKPQYIKSEDYQGTVYDVLRNANPQAVAPGSWLYIELVKKLRLDRLFDRQVSDLSGGELQKLAVAQTLAMEADIYLLDEPSAYLDVEERLTVAKTIRRLTETREVAAFVVEHDVVLEDYVSDKLIVILGEPGYEGRASQPLPLREGMNMFLRDLGVTFRRDPDTGRPRVNKEGSYLDRMQKAKGEYYYE
ncbi:MAG: ribosome biogenesis/translation initiation ATPase RLI [Desulfurococcales archaeon]|nr:ribosome biogenesis/translation initiation ATPase RLI [Desulfurococcales archaeon]